MELITNNHDTAPACSTRDICASVVPTAAPVGRGADAVGVAAKRRTHHLLVMDIAHVDEQMGFDHQLAHEVQVGIGTALGPLRSVQLPQCRCQLVSDAVRAREDFAGEPVGSVLLLLQAAVLGQQDCSDDGQQDGQEANAVQDGNPGLDAPHGTPVGGMALVFAALTAPQIWHAEAVRAILGITSKARSCAYPTYLRLIWARNIKGIPTGALRMRDGHTTERG